MTRKREVNGTNILRIIGYGEYGKDNQRCGCGRKLYRRVPRQLYAKHTFGDLHLYTNHLEQSRLQLTRSPWTLPTMTVNPAVDDIDAFTFQDFELQHYQPHPHIKAEVSV